MSHPTPIGCQCDHCGERVARICRHVGCARCLDTTAHFCFSAFCPQMALVSVFGFLYDIDGMSGVRIFPLGSCFSPFGILWSVVVCNAHVDTTIGFMVYAERPAVYGGFLMFLFLLSCLVR